MLDFYKSILSVGSLTSTQDGLISAEIDNAVAPFTVGGKRLVLPTAAHLANPNKDGVVLFHPLSENILRNESEVMARFRSAVNLRINYVIGSLLHELLVLATSPGSHHKLKPDQFELISVFKDADEKTLLTLQSLLRAMPQGNIEKSFVHIFIKKGAMINGKSHRRGAIVSFPLYDELCKNETGAFGVKLRKKDHASLKAILECVFPKICEKDVYSKGSHSDTAPTLDALLLAILGLASHINALVDDYTDALEDIADLRYADEWVSALDNLEQFANEIRLIPMQSGNEGVVDRAVTQQNPTAASPVQQNPTPQVLQMPPPTQPYYNNPGQAYAPQMAQVQSGPTEVTTSTGLLDFAATLRNNPAMAPMGQMYPMQQPNGPVGARMAEPRWAANQYNPQSAGQYPLANQGYGQQYGQAQPGYGQQSNIYI